MRRLRRYYYAPGSAVQFSGNPVEISFRPVRSIQQKGRLKHAKMLLHMPNDDREPQQREGDYTTIGKIVTLYSYIDVNLRRIIGATENAGILQEPYARTRDVPRLDPRGSANSGRTIARTRTP